MNEHHLLQPALKEETCNGSDTNIVVNEIYQPSSLDNIPSDIDHECRFASHLTNSSTNITQEVSQAANHNCGLYTEYGHLDSTNNARYGLESSSSETELNPSAAEVAVGLETELLSLVAELFQGSLREAKYCERRCHDTYSKEIGCRIGCEDQAKNIPSNDCVQLRQNGNRTSGCTQRNQSAGSEDQMYQGLESWDAAKLTQVTAGGSVSRNPRLPVLNVDVDFNQTHLFPGEKANVSSTFTNLSTARTGKSLLVKGNPSHQLNRESMVNYIPAKYWDRQKWTSVFTDQDTPLCATTQNSWETAAGDAIRNPVQLAGFENHACWEQSANNSSGCVIEPHNSMHQLNEFNFCRLRPLGNYISNRKHVTRIDASDINEHMDCSDIPPYLGLPLNGHEKEINNELLTFNKLITRRLASSENMRRRVRGGCSVLEENVFDGIYQTQDPWLQITDEPHQHAESIHVSPNQQKCNDNAYGNLLDTSNYSRKNELQKGESQPFLSFSKPIPACNFNEINQTSKESLTLFPSETFCNNERIKNRKLRNLTRVADMKEARFCHMTPTNSKNQPSFHSLSPCVSPADNKDSGESCLSYSVSYTRMESVVEQIGTPLQYINDDIKIIKYERHKHTRSCRRRFGIDSTACCFMCLPEVPLDEHTVCGGNTLGKRTSKKKHKNSRVNSSKYLTQRSANNRSGRTYGRSINNKFKQSGRRRGQHSRSRSTVTRRRRISKTTGNRGKRRRSTSTDSRHRRTSKKEGNRAKRRRSTSTGWRRRSRGSTNSGRRHRNKPRSTGLRRLIRQPTYQSKVYRPRKPKGTGLHSGGGRTRKAR